VRCVAAGREQHRRCGSPLWRQNKANSYRLHLLAESGAN
jgi:hypothetical protein